MSNRDDHRRVYKQIPSFKCKEGCTACCGVIPVTPWEAERLGISGELIIPTKADGTTCQFATDSGCSVYDRRPYICRVFGTVDTPLLQCPHGCRSKQLLSEVKSREFMKLIYDDDAQSIAASATKELLTKATEPS